MIIATNSPLLPSKLRLFYGKVSPARHAFDADGDDREVVEHHRAVLGVARAQQGLRAVVLGTVAHDKADRYEVGRRPRVGGREMTDPTAGQKAGLAIGQHAGNLA